MSRHSLLLVEGPHDEAFAAAVLRARHELSPVIQEGKLDPFWKPLVPRSFPHDGDLRKRVPVPQFYADESTSLAILVAGSDSKLAKECIASLQVLEGPVDAVGLVLDSDSKVSAIDRFEGVRSRLAARSEVFDELPAQPGVVAGRAPSCGIFVLPDNHSQGTLEELLVACASQSYGVAFTDAQRYVDRVHTASFEDEELRELRAPAGQRKAEVAALGAILKPGKSIQVSLQDNRWVTDDTLAIAPVRAFYDFLHAVVFGSASGH